MNGFQLHIFLMYEGNVLPKCRKQSNQIALKTAESNHQISTMIAELLIKRVQLNKMVNSWLAPANLVIKTMSFLRVIIIPVYPYISSF